MKRLLIFCASAILAGTLAVSAQTSTNALIQLQFTMHQFLEARSVGGAIVNLNLDTGYSEKLYVIESHPMVIELPDSFVLCSDLAKEDGSTVPIDVYIQDTSEGFEVIRFEIDNREPLKHLMNLGLAKRLK